MKRERYPAVVTEIVEEDKIFTVYMRYARHNFDFGPPGRLHGRLPSFQNYHIVEGFSRLRKPADYSNFGIKGLAAGVKIWVYHKPGQPDNITYIMPKVRRTRGRP